jgi:hypothetical protein
MKLAIYAIAGTLAVSALAGVSGNAAPAGAVVEPAVYKPIQAISHYFGSKHAVGYYQAQGGVCAMTVFIAEDTGGLTTTPSATRMKFTVKPGDKAELGSVEAQTLEITCGADAQTVEVRTGGFPAAYVTR